MPNSQLINKAYAVPDKVLNRVNQMLTRLEIGDKQARGLQRAKDIVKNKKLTHSNMARLKNYFDNYKGMGDDDEYRLIGGDVTKKWVNDSLGLDRDAIKQVKKTKMDGGMENQFLKTHTKDNDNANPTNAKGGMIDAKNSFKSRNIMANGAIYKSSTNAKSASNEDYIKEINSMKYLIEYLNKK